MAKVEKRLTKKGVEKKEYPKLISVGNGKKVKVLNKEEEAKHLEGFIDGEGSKSKAWGGKNK